MVITQINIEIAKDKKLRFGFDLLKREDWSKEEWELAEIIESILMDMIKMIVKEGKAILIKQQIIK